MVLRRFSNSVVTYHAWKVLLNLFDHVINLNVQYLNVDLIQGCEKRKCPDRKVFRNSTSDECISPNDCDCMVINGKVYKENDKISSDECHSW